MIHKKKTYLDFASATPIGKEALKTFIKTSQVFANPSAIHEPGSQAKALLEEARENIAVALGAHKDEIVFTSGGTESDTLALLGTMKALSRKFLNRKLHVIVSEIEHSAILESAKELEFLGVDVSYAPVTQEGVIDLVEFKKLLKDTTVLVSVMHANNEIGTIQPIKEIAKICRHFRKERNTELPLYVHTDACQSFVYFSIRVEELGVDLLTINSSKIYGPKGVGVLYKKRGVGILPIIFGGPQEGGLRAGTENLPLIRAFSTAVSINEKIKNKVASQLAILRDKVVKDLKEKIPTTIFNGSFEERLPNNINITVPGISSEVLVLYLDSQGFSVSEKSACKSTDPNSSYVIEAIRKNTEVGDQTEGSIRITMGKTTKEKDMKEFIEALLKSIEISQNK